MLRKHSIIKFVLLSIIAILGILLCVCPFAVPYSTSNYNGLMGAINKGVDINGGVSAVYECKLPENSNKNLTEAIDDSISKIKTMFENEGYQELFVSRQGGNKVSVVVSGANATDYAFDFMEDRKVMSFTLSKYSDSLTNPEVYMTSNVVSKVRPSYDYEKQSYGVVVEFSSEGQKQLQQLKQQAEDSGNETVYIYLGEICTENTFAEINYEDIDEKSMFLSTSSTGSYSISDGQSATEFAYTIASGSLDVELELKEVGNVSAVFGKNTTLYLGICAIVIVLATMLFMYIRYGHLGLLANLSIVFSLVLYIFLMQAIPFITINLAGVIASLVSFALVVFANAYVFEKIKEEYAIGKKIHLSVKGGFKKALWPILDSHILLALASVFVWIFAPASYKIVGISIIIGAIVSLFSALAMTRYFVKIYLPLNSTKAKKLRLYREKNVREVKDDEVEIIPEGAEMENLNGGNNE